MVGVHIADAAAVINLKGGAAHAAVSLVPFALAVVFGVQPACSAAAILTMFITVRLCSPRWIHPKRSETSNLCSYQAP
jgi:hypothetical protein